MCGWVALQETQRPAVVDIGLNMGTKCTLTPVPFSCGRAGAPTETCLPGLSVIVIVFCFSRIWFVAASHEAL